MGVMAIGYDMVGRTIVAMTWVALACSPDSEKVGELDTEQASTGPAGDSEDQSASGPTGSATAGTQGTSGETEGVDDSTGDPGATGGAQVDACEFPQGTEGFPNDADGCPFELPRPCDDVLFSADVEDVDVALTNPDAAQCVLDQLTSGAVAVVTVRRTDFDTAYDYRGDAWLFDDGTAIVEADGYEDKSSLGSLPQTFMRPDPAQFAECSVDDPVEELYACLVWWQTAECIDTPAECDQALP
jgi:hypothetical protein